VILLSDHGEGLGDHGDDAHGCFVYESTLHVPLILHWPAGVTPIGPRDDHPVGLIDVAPAILEFLHIPIPPSFNGASLLQHDQRPVYSESVHARDAFGWAPLRALRSGAFKYIDAPHPELYDLQHDPQEARNLITADAVRARALRAQISKLLARDPAASASSAPNQVSPQTDALLHSLGYLSPGPRSTVTGQAPDPKDRLAELHLYEKAEAETNAVRLSSAAILLNKVLDEDPQNTLARRDLGMIYVETKVLTKARSCFEKVLAAAPDDYLSHYELGIVEARLGQPEEALRQMQMACRLAPGSEQCRVELERLQHSASVVNQK
jgi:tetratricopeptide (TPR) repeat protein